TAICRVCGCDWFTHRRVSMADSIAGVVLAAGAGERLRPLTRLRPKALCPVGDAPLVDHALARFDGVTDALTVNVHHHREQLEAHLAGRVHVSVEHPAALGTAGALGALREWIGGRACMVANADTWCPTSLAVLLDGWDGQVVRVLSPTPGPLGPRTMIGGALLPWSEIEPLAATPSGLYEAVWAPVMAEGRLEIVPLADGAPLVDCGTPGDYLAANLAWSGGSSVIGREAVIDGTVESSVVWPGAHVRASEHLVGAIRADDRMTVLVR
ncbi:MAG: sugar phosphate nucleotidyltransferase, partial [Acidimicrobiales bacterium]